MGTFRLKFPLMVYLLEMVQIVETQRESSSKGNLHVQRETLQPKKSMWSVGSKGAPTTGKKESLRAWKAILDKKKKQGASCSDSDTSERA